MAVRRFSNTTTDGALASGVGASDTTMTLTSFAGAPLAPFTAVIERDTANEEIVLVTGISGLVVNVSRGFDGTTARSHAAGSKFQHVTTAIDFTEANAHVNAVGAVHGVTGALVGTSDTQTLSNKTLIGPVATGGTHTGGTFTGPAVVDGAYTGTQTMTNLVVTTKITVPIAVTGTDATNKNYVDTIKTTIDGAVTALTTRVTNLEANRVRNWGSGTSYPGSPAPGDVFYHTTLKAQMCWINSEWKQTNLPSHTVATRDALATGLLTSGFAVWLTDQNQPSRWNGTKWMGGDSGWINLTLNSPLTIGPEGAMYRVKNDVLYLRIHNTYGGSYSANFPWTTLPVGARPARTHWALFGPSSGTQTVELRVQTDGVIQSTPAWGGGAGVISFSLPLD